MEPMRLPSHGAIYLDTSALIYSVERNEPYLTLLAPAWRQAEAGQLVVVCSELVISETLVRPLREGNTDLEAAFRAVFCRSGGAVDSCNAPLMGGYCPSAC